MKRLVVGILLAVFSTFAQAGFLVDAWKTGAPEEVCKWASDQVGYAINRRLVNVPFLFKDKSELPPVYDINRVPRDALYITSWDKLDQVDKDFLTRFVQLGYTLAEKKLKENPNAKFPEDFGGEYTRFMASCVTHKNNQEELFQLIKTASSESIRGVPIGTETPVTKTGLNEEMLICQELIYDINLIARAKSEDEPMEDLVNLAKKSEDQLRPDRLARILRMIPEAYLWKGDMIDWMNEEYKECKTN